MGRLFGRFRKQESPKSQKLVIPTHIAIIPDGNRRWAKQRRLPTIAGHKAGADAFRNIVRYAGNLGVKYISFYAFSTENWKRDPHEVSGLMDLMRSFLQNSDAELGADKYKLRIRIIGRRSELPEDLQKEIARIEEETAENRDLVLFLAINYGGREELISSFQQLAQEVEDGKRKASDIDEELIGRSLYTEDAPEPDLLIRTSGEQRISNFLLWQLAYTEFYFVPFYWPDFDEQELDKAIVAFNKRQRRFGGN